MFKCDITKFKKAKNNIDKTYSNFINNEAIMLRIINKASDLLTNELIDEMENLNNQFGEYGNLLGQKTFINMELTMVKSYIREIKNSIDKYEESLSNIASFKEYLIQENSKKELDSSNLNSEVKVDFCKLTDKQYNEFGWFCYNFAEDPTIFKDNKGKAIKDMSGITVETRDALIKKGFGDLIVHDVMLDIYGNGQTLVLKDEIGNYTLVYPCTRTPELNGDKTVYETMKEFEDIVYDLGEFLGINAGLSQLEKISVGNYAKRYYELAKKEGKSVNFYGYSKGGGVAEIAYLSVATELENAKKDKTLGDIVIYNPLHANLTDEGVKLLKETDDLTVYRIQGDLISTYNHENTFDAETIFVRCDWVSVYGTETSPKEYSGLVEFGMRLLDPDWAMIAKNKENLNYLGFGGAHSLGKYDSDLAFDKYGNSIYNKESYLYSLDGIYTSREVLMYLFGVENVHLWNDK